MLKSKHIVCGIFLGLGLIATPEAWAGSEDTDWANLHAFRQRDADLIARGPIPHSVVFMGDSITEFWDQDHQNQFAEPTHINRGISGQTTQQMLLRFRQDVIALQPETVIILAGTNDIAGNTGVTTNAMIEDNIASMAELARSHGIRVILASVLPADHYWWAPDIKPAARIADLNLWLKAFAAKQGAGYINFFTPMADQTGGLKPEYGADGVHPNAAGYAVMNRLVRDALSTPPSAPER
ncbi:hypothetical protein MMA231_03865 (plasmid) [Asticcacaulis sp. MM231]|uniref:SGNH/GDSL hydrolase family protein n=1 Tax=Asticcacaulis sp. MM231 TaxID=3157666 RepID=UPI0032D5AA4D